MERDGRVIKIYERDSLLKGEIKSRCHHMCYISSLTTAPDKPPKIGKPACAGADTPITVDSPLPMPGTTNEESVSQSGGGHYSPPTSQDIPESHIEKGLKSVCQEEKLEESSHEEKHSDSQYPSDQADDCEKSSLEQTRIAPSVDSLECPESAESKPHSSLQENPNSSVLMADQICNGEHTALPKQDSQESQQKTHDKNHELSKEPIQAGLDQEEIQTSDSKISGKSNSPTTKSPDSESTHDNTVTSTPSKQSVDSLNSEKTQSKSVASPNDNSNKILENPVPVRLAKVDETETVDPPDKMLQDLAPKSNLANILLPDEVHIPSDSEIHIAESCRYCHEVRLYDMERQEAFAVFRTPVDIKPTRVCGGPSRTVFVYIGDDNILQLKLNIEDTVLEQVSSFTVPVTKAVTEMHYVPRQDILVIADYDGGEVLAVKLNTKQGLVKNDAVCEAVWRLGGTGMVIEGSKMWPYDICGNDDGSLIYITDDFNERLLSLDPRFGQMQQVTFEEDYGYIHHVMFFTTQPHLAIHHHKTKISCFALQY